MPHEEVEPCDVLILCSHYVDKTYWNFAFILMHYLSFACVAPLSNIAKHEAWKKMCIKGAIYVWTFSFYSFVLAEGVMHNFSWCTNNLMCNIIGLCHRVGIYRLGAIRIIQGVPSIKNNGMNRWIKTELTHSRDGALDKTAEWATLWRMPSYLILHLCMKLKVI